ncbi:hypothetical protein SAMN03097699_1646 [Flavobacteriaceae bacterium MAR_2010_188]|nr:hypothetical protein SAMN03097699_1646 [Flavobacteriaceae bacterium MAR_2010_188]
MEIFTSLVDNYKESMTGLNNIVKVAITTVLALVILSVLTAVVNIFVVGVQ